MELWLTFVALYAWQCLVWLHAPSAVFGPRWLGWSELHRRGVHLLSCWPSTLGVVASRLPFALVEDAARLSVQRGDALETGESIELADIALDLRGARVVANGRTLIKAASKAQARIWLLALAELAGSPAAGRDAVWRRLLDASLDDDALRERLAEARRKTRWLAWLCDVDLLLMGIGVAAIGLLFGGEYALAICLPVLGGVHVAAVALAFLTHRRLIPEQRGERFEELFMATLYPPALLRCPRTWVDTATAGFHPLTWVRTLAGEDEARRVWLRERARLERAAVRRPDLADSLRSELDAIDAAMPADWRAPRPRHREDPSAESYCPVCWDDFRSGFDRCSSCDAETIRYAPAAS